MKILIDADGCPVTRIACEVSKKHNLECVVISDTSHVFNIEGVRTITVSKGNDSVDFYLVNMLEKGDVVVTQDYGLAAMCLARGAIPINQNGMIYDNDNIIPLLNDRHSAKLARMHNKRVKGPSKRDKMYDLIFKEKLEELIIKKHN